MKLYTFRLEPVLKIRRLKEETCRMELGRMITQLNKIESQLAHDRQEIERYFEIQEKAMQVGMKGNQVQAFPMLVAAKDANIQALLRDKKAQEDLIEEKKKELATLRGDLKVIENLKDKDYTEYRKALNKEIDQKVEEQTQNWLQHKEQKV
jgi:flagellar protein FliJ